MMFRVRSWWWCTLAALSAGVALQVRAEVLEEIIVTAQKREQSLQDVGLSVSAFTGEQVRELGFRTTTDVTAFTPGLNFTSPQAEGSQVNFFLRGVGLNDFADANENPVAAYFDEVYRGAMGGLSLQLFDIDRIEVLRGPQGTLYGRNTTGGLVHFLSRRPTETPEGYVQLGVGERGRLQFEGAAGGPITSGLSGRIAVSTEDQDGYVKNRAPGVDDYNAIHARAARGQLLWNGTENASLLLAVHHSRNDAQVGGWQHQVIGVSDGGDGRVALGPADTNTACPTGPGQDCFGYRDTDNDPWAGEFDRDGKLEVEARGVSARLELQLGEVSLVNIAALDRVDRLQEEDTDAGPFPLLIPTFSAGTEQITEELRLSGERGDDRWLAGFYWYEQTVDGRYLLDLLNLGFLAFDANYTQDTTSWSVFGQYEYAFAPRWTLVAGLRYTQEERELDYLNLETSGFFTGEVGLPDDVAFDFDTNAVGDLARHDDDNLTGRLELDYRPSDDWLWYASASKGMKSAGFNNGFLDGTGVFGANSPATIPFGEETLYAYEIGFKATLLDGAARLNASAFTYDYQDFQTFRFELLNQAIFNTDARVSGGEVELQWNPAEGWDLAFGLSVLDATAKDIPASASGRLRDRDMVSAPGVSLNGMLRREWELPAGRVAALLKARYQGETWFDIQNYRTSRENGFAVADARVQWRSADEHWEVAGFVDNLTNEKYLVYTFDFAAFGFNQQAWGRPRWAGASVRYRW
jgi:iron complex outermembrane receptor protein